MIKQFVNSEVCLECKGCCRFAETCSVWPPSLTDPEIKELLQNNIPPAVISDKKQIRLIPDTKEGCFVCPLLDLGSNKCRVYSLRPLECQLYPFLINRNKDKVFLSIDLNCPFAKEKEASLELKEYINYLTGILRSPDYKELLKKNPQIIKSYPDVLDLGEI